MKRHIWLIMAKKNFLRKDDKMDDKKRKLYLAYTYEIDDEEDEDGYETFDEYLQLTAIFISKEDAKKYILKNKISQSNNYSAIVEYEQGLNFSLECKIPLSGANFTKTENNHLYLIDDGKKELIR